MEVFIEISKNSKLKYEHDEDNNRLVLDRVLQNTNTFPYNYGYLPNTLSPDGDPLDIIILCEYELVPGSKLCLLPYRHFDYTHLMLFLLVMMMYQSFLLLLIVLNPMVWIYLEV